MHFFKPWHLKMCHDLYAMIIGIGLSRIKVYYYDDKDCLIVKLSFIDL